MPKHLTIDEALKITNAFGRYQIFMAFMFASWVLPTFCNYAFFGFAGVEPHWTCERYLNESIKFGQDCEIFSSCPEQNLTFRSDFYSVPQEWSLVCEKSYIPNLIASLLNVGQTVGAICFGPVVDNFGRKWTAVSSLTFLAFSGLFSAFSKSWQMLAIGETIIGIAVGCVSASTYIFASEFTTNNYRLILRTTGGSSFVRLAAQALIGYVSSHWRPYLIYTSFFALVSLVLTFFCVHESPRWLLQKERNEDAQEIIVKIAKFNGNKAPLPANFELLTVKNKKSKFYMWDLFKNGQVLSMYTIFCATNYFESGLLFVVLMLELNKLTSSFNLFLSVLSVGALSLVSLAVAVLEFKHPQSMNRRRLLIILNSSLLICMGAISVLSARIIESPALLSGSAVLCYTLALVKADFNSTICIELFPTLMRATVFSLCIGCLSLSSIIAPQLLYLSKWWPPLPYVLLFIANIVTLLLTLLIYPNTNAMELTEVEKFTAKDMLDLTAATHNHKLSISRFPALMVEENEHKLKKYSESHLGQIQKRKSAIVRKISSPQLTTIV